MTDRWERIAGGVGEELAAADRHPEPEELIAYHRRELAAERHDEVQEHLTGCPECASLVLEFAGHWEEPREPWHRRVGPLRGLAAASLVVAVGLAVWGLLGGSDRVRVGVQPVFDLKADSASGSRGEENRVQLSAAASWLSLYVDAPEGDPEEEFGIDLVAAGERRVTGLKSMKRLTETGSLNLEVSREFLRPSDYLLRVWSLTESGDRDEPLETYSFTLVREEPSEPSG